MTRRRGNGSITAKVRNNFGKQYGPYVVLRNVGEGVHSEYVVVGCPCCGYERSQHREQLALLRKIVKCAGCGKRVEQIGKVGAVNG
jgi:hypothetical protein